MLHLASRSPRRSELLARLGFAFGVLELDIPEHRQPGEPAEDYVRRVAREKAGAGLLQVMSTPAAVVSVSDVTVAALDEPAIADYLATREWDGKAGAYGIQGRAQVFIEHLSGSYSAVMGLPLFETARLLREFGVVPQGAPA